LAAARLPPAVLLMGPTASGKSALAAELARRFPVSIVSVDSVLVFRDMKIGAARPDEETLARYPHRLIDLITPEERYSAARFREDALGAMAEITAAGNIPLLTGGTMLYFKALRDGLSDLPPASFALRAQIEEEAERRGWAAMHAKLAALDSVTAARLKPGDRQRIQRALEVCVSAGRPMSELLAASSSEPPPYRFLSLILFPGERSALHERIALRFREMLSCGLIEEVEGLRARYRLFAELPSMRSVGYRQVWEYLEGRLRDREDLLARGIAATRQLAKRQITWLSNDFSGARFDCLDECLFDRVAARVESFLRETA
jgi:tRNA dimethylallyltransferase